MHGTSWVSRYDEVNSPMIASGIKGMAAGFMGGAAAGYVGNYVLTGNYYMASQAAIYGGVYGGITGFAGGAGAGYRYAKKHSINIWNGEPEYYIDSDLYPTLERILNNQKYPYRHDGTIFRNQEGILPQQDGIIYREYVHPTPGVSGAGKRRIVLDNKGGIYYTDDHYHSFFKLK